jgi:RimJ/RimL family protein N-acetyltransferase
MESMVAAFAGAHRSKRLVFRAVEDNDEDKDYMWNNLFSNPVNTGLANIGIFRPASKKGFQKDFEMITTKTLLCVLICLPPPETQPGEEEEVEEEEEAADTKKDGAKDKAEKKEPKPTPIGFICLSKNEMDSFRRRTMVGLQLAEPYQNKGYGREAINWAVDWAFAWADMHRVDIGTPAFNERAAALYESMGFKPEGAVREAFFSE